MSFFDFHVHSYFSSDANIAPEKLVRAARRRGLSGVAITDHNTVRGGLETKRKNRDSSFLVIVGAEIRTEACEIIGLFLNQEVSSTDPLEVMDEVRGQGGITVLPHPFRSYLLPHQKGQKRAPMEIIEKIDVLEAVNARTRVRDNQQALALASRMGKPVVAGSDAHFYQEVGRVKTLVAPFNSEEDLRKTLLEGRTRVEEARISFLKVMPFLLLSALHGRARRLSRRSRVGSRTRSITKT